MWYGMVWYGSYDGGGGGDDDDSYSYGDDYDVYGSFTINTTTIYTNTSYYHSFIYHSYCYLQEITQCVSIMDTKITTME